MWPGKIRCNRLVCQCYFWNCMQCDGWCCMQGDSHPQPVQSCSIPDLFVARMRHDEVSRDVGAIHFEALIWRDAR